MERTINVRGVGSLRRKPDYVVLALELEAKDEEYGRAVDRSSEQIGELTAALERAGFPGEELKTSSYQVRTDYRSEQDEKGNYRQVFDGYVCHTGLRLAFDFSPSALNRALSAVGETTVRPEVNISFTLRDPGEANSELLRAACQNAREKAEVLCQAAGVRLGRLLRVEYDWSEPSVRSRSSFDGAVAGIGLMKNVFRPEMAPEDVELRDSAGFVWEID